MDPMGNHMTIFTIIKHHYHITITPGTTSSTTLTTTIDQINRAVAELQEAAVAHHVAHRVDITTTVAVGSDAVLTDLQHRYMEFGGDFIKQKTTSCSSYGNFRKHN